MIYISDELSHYGVRGMKWGVRKQMPTTERIVKKRQQVIPEERKARAKKAAKVGAAVAVTALAVYGGKKLHDKQVLQMANAMAERGYGKGPNYFDSYKSVKNAWNGNYRQMISDVSDYSPRSRRFSPRELDSMGIKTFNVIDDSVNRNRFR